MHSSRSVRLAALAFVLALSAAGWAKKPEDRPGPMECPDDVAAALTAECPCEGIVLPDGSVAPHKNHGQYVRCVVHFRNALRKSGCLSQEAHKTVARCAARSTCGKEGAVVCCFSRSGTCDDPAPGNGMTEGVCSNDEERACDTEAECVRVRGRVTRDEAACVDAGGTVAGPGSVCTRCTTTTTTSTTSTTSSTTSTTSTTVP